MIAEFRHFYHPFMVKVLKTRRLFVKIPARFSLKDIEPVALLLSVYNYLTGILSMRRWWRPPSKGVVRKACTI